MTIVIPGWIIIVLKTLGIGLLGFFAICGIYFIVLLAGIMKDL